MSFLDKYIAYLTKEKNSKKESGNVGMQFRASGIGLCERKNVYSALGFEKKEREGGEDNIALKVGTALHELLQDDFMRAGLIRNMRDRDGKPDEVEIIREDLRLSGHVDGLYDLPDGKFGVFEFKSASTFAFEPIVSKIKKPKKAHTEQANLYAGLLGASEITIFYANKNGGVTDAAKDYFEENGLSQSFAVFTLPFNQELFDSSIEKVKRMHKFVDEYPTTGKLPNKVSDNQCNYCPFYWTCKEEAAQKRAANRAAKQENAEKAPTKKKGQPIKSNKLGDVLKEDDRDILFF